MSCEKRKIFLLLLRRIQCFYDNILMFVDKIIDLSHITCLFFLGFHDSFNIELIKLFGNDFGRNGNVDAVKEIEQVVKDVFFYTVVN